MITLPPPTQTNSHSRLRTAIKRLVIELGYLEQYLSQEPSNSEVQTAAVHIDSAITCLNEHLSR